ncbi:tRNA (guanosine(46)-N7)-methyltransferase TrmB [Endothiovibrio diazotrophicus]
MRREGRMTDGQKRAFDELWAQFGIDLPEKGMIDLAAAFGRDAPTVVEIGFGNGESLAEMAADDPARNYLGIEVHRPGVGHLLRVVEERGLGHVRAMSEDAVVILEQHIADGALDGVQLFFPDPWHKKRHRKRRILQPPFVELIARKLHPGGTFHMATDWAHYAEQMMEVMSASESFENAFGEGAYAPRPEHRPLTKFEQRGQRLGHGVWDLIFLRK